MRNGVALLSNSVGVMFEQELKQRSVGMYPLRAGDRGTCDANVPETADPQSPENKRISVEKNDKNATGGCGSCVFSIQTNDESGKLSNQNNLFSIDPPWPFKRGRHANIFSRETYSSSRLETGARRSDMPSRRMFRLADAVPRPTPRSASSRREGTRLHLLCLVDVR